MLHIAKLKNIINGLVNSPDDRGKVPLLKASNKEAISFLDSIKPPKLKFHQISKDVNNPMNNDPRLIKAI